MARRSRGAVPALVVAALLCGPAAAPAGAADEPRLTLRDSLYVLPLAPPVASPECNAILCPIAQPFAPVGSGRDAGVSGLRVTGFPLAPPGVVAEARSEPLPYDGAGEDGTASVRLSADRVAQGAGGTVLTGVRLQEAGGRIVAELPVSGLPVDGTRRTAGPVEIPPSRLVLGRSYVAVATFRLSVPAGGSVAARVYAPRLLALGPTTPPAAARTLRIRRPTVTLTGRRLEVVVRCPAGPVRCDVETRSAVGGRTVGKGDADLQAGAEHAFTYRLSAAELRRARRAGRITTRLRIVDERRRTGTARSTLRVPRR